MFGAFMPDPSAGSKDAKPFAFNFGAASQPSAQDAIQAPDKSIAELRPGREVFPTGAPPTSWDFVPLRGAGDLSSSDSDASASVSEDGEEGRGDLLLRKVRLVGSAARELLKSGEAEASDVVAGTYEGGLKLWECAEDLSEYLCREGRVVDDVEGACTSSGDAAPLQLRGARVLELGCGHGIPGIVAALGGAREVCFQDYNEEVLDAATKPNVDANVNARLASNADAASLPALRYFAGDWGSLAGPLLNHAEPFDLVLAAETVYDLSGSSRLLALLKEVTHPDRGRVLVAAKAYYFGVGGGSREFARLVQDDGHFDCQVVWASQDGVSNIREILELRPRPRK